MNCHEYTVPGAFDTGGRPVYGWKCFCGTTTCMKQRPIQNYREIEQVSLKRFGELSPEEEARIITI